jgi:hypothetical protein
VNLKKSLEKLFQGWLPKEIIVPTHKSARAKSRWQNPYWITLTLVVVVALAGLLYFEQTRMCGLQTHLMMLRLVILKKQ